MFKTNDLLISSFTKILERVFFCSGIMLHLASLLIGRDPLRRLWIDSMHYHVPGTTSR